MSCHRNNGARRALSILLCATGAALSVGATTAQAAGAYYETFGGLGIAAGKLDNPSYGYGQGSVSGNATNVAAGGGYVYWQDGVNIWRANSDLSGAAIWHVNGLSPTDFTIDPARAVAPVPEPAAWTLMLAGFGAIGLIARRRRAMLAA
jgi:hypothetical protein